jgi:hypothetical protein
LDGGIADAAPLAPAAAPAAAATLELGGACGPPALGTCSGDPWATPPPVAPATEPPAALVGGCAGCAGCAGTAPPLAVAVEPPAIACAALPHVHPVIA